MLRAISEYINISESTSTALLHKFRPEIKDTAVQVAEIVLFNLPILCLFSTLNIETL